MFGWQQLENVYLLIDTRMPEASALAWKDQIEGRPGGLDRDVTRVAGESLVPSAPIRGLVIKGGRARVSPPVPRIRLASRPPRDVGGLEERPVSHKDSIIKL